MEGVLGSGAGCSGTGTERDVVTVTLSFDFSRVTVAVDPVLVVSESVTDGTEVADEEVVVMVGGIELDGGGGCTTEAGREVEESVEGEELRASRLLVCR